MDPGTLLRAARARAGLSQRELAHRAGTSAAAVCLYETGARVPRVDTLARLVAATGATLRLSAVSGSVDVEANGRALLEVLDLADHLPKRRDGDLAAPVFAHLVLGRSPSPAP